MVYDFSEEADLTNEQLDAELLAQMIVMEDEDGEETCEFLDDVLKEAKE